MDIDECDRLLLWPRQLSGPYASNRGLVFRFVFEYAQGLTFGRHELTETRPYGLRYDPLNHAWEFDAVGLFALIDIYFSIFGPAHASVQIPIPTRMQKFYNM